MLGAGTCGVRSRLARFHPTQATAPPPSAPQLGVFQFFLCWFAFYVIKGDGGGGVDALLSRPQSAGLTSSVRKVSACCC